MKSGWPASLPFNIKSFAKKGPNLLFQASITIQKLKVFTLAPVAAKKSLIQVTNSIQVLAGQVSQSQSKKAVSATKITISFSLNALKCAAVIAVGI